MNWLTNAAMLPGKAPLAVGLALWFEVGRKSRKTVVLTQAVLNRLNVNRKAGYRGLTSLEAAQLIKVERRCGRSPAVTVLEVAEATQRPGNA